MAAKPPQLDTQQWLAADPVQLPRPASDEDFRGRLCAHLDDYVASIRRLAPDTDLATAIVDNRQQIADSARYIKEAVGFSYRGCGHRAYKSFGKAFQAIMRAKAQLLFTIKEMGAPLLYRLRVTDLNDLGRGDIFHIPF